jgi:hypothetical protein
MARVRRQSGQDSTRALFWFASATLMQLLRRGYAHRGMEVVLCPRHDDELALDEAVPASASCPTRSKSPVEPLAGSLCWAEPLVTLSWLSRGRSDRPPEIWHLPPRSPDSRIHPGGRSCHPLVAHNGERRCMPGKALPHRAFGQLGGRPTHASRQVSSGGPPPQLPRLPGTASFLPQPVVDAGGVDAVVRGDPGQ